ncbi:grancalcin-like isoform X2 [Tubulanus polymorphus]|uniref:grancalcin-like isoform X2 n=1 Tax=Tubulanus polymorphus TaxID=672921 RepID=UPI003DA4F762
MNFLNQLSQYYALQPQQQQQRQQAGGGYHHQQYHQQYPQQQYQQHQLQQPPPPSQHYGEYATNVQQNIYQIQAWQRINGIQGEELQYILNTTPRIQQFYGINWSLELCKIMIAMLDRSKDGIMQYNEFRELLQCLVYWKQTFDEVDVDRSKFVEANELLNTIMQRYGYRLSRDALTTLMKRYSKAVDDGSGKLRCLIAFDDFVSLSVRLRAYTEAFRARDRLQHRNVETGKYEFTYDDFLQCTMCL